MNIAAMVTDGRNNDVMVVVERLWDDNDVLRGASCRRVFRSAGQDHEEMLDWSEGSEVIWRAFTSEAQMNRASGGEKGWYRRYGVGRHGGVVIDASRVQFGEAKGVCLLRSPGDMLYVGLDEGEVMEIPLPCTTTRIWAFKWGLFVQRIDDDHDHGDGESESSKSRNQDNAYIPLPSFFSLAHPLDELKPVEIEVDLEGGPDGDDGEEVSIESHGNLLCDVTEVPVFVHQDLPVMVTYSLNHQRHSVWVIKGDRKANNHHSNLHQNKSKDEGDNDDCDDDVEPKNEDVEDDDDIHSVLSALHGSNMSTTSLFPGETGDLSPPPLSRKVSFSSSFASGNGLMGIDDALASALGVTQDMSASINDSSRISFAKDAHSTAQQPSVGGQMAPSISPDFCLQLVYRESRHSGTMAKRVFVTRNERYLVLVRTDEDVMIYRCSPGFQVISLERRIPCRDACVLQSYEDDVIFMVHLDGSASILRPDVDMIGIRVDAGQGIERLCDIVSNRVTLIIIAKGNREATRIQIELQVHDSVIQRILRSYDHVLPPDVALTFRVMMKRCLQMGEDSETIDGEWTGFFKALIEDDHENVDQEIDDFTRMINSPFHQEYLRMNHKVLDCLESIPTRGSLEAQDTIPTTRRINTLMRSHITGLFDSMHLIYEDIKLSVSTWNAVVRLGSILSALCAYYGEESNYDFIEYYRRDIGEGLHRFHLAPQSELEERISRFDHVPSVMDHLMDAIHRKPFPQCAGDCCSLTRKITGAYEVLSRHGDVVLYMTKEKIDRSLLATLPFGVSLPLLEALRTYQKDCPSTWPREAYVLVGRDDLAMRRRIEQDEEIGRRIMTSVLNKQAAAGRATLMSERSSLTIDDETDIGQDEGDGLYDIECISTLRFGHDYRLHEATRLLRCTKPVLLHVKRSPEVSDLEYLQRQQARLLLLCKRALSSPIGRGMLTLRSFRPNLAAEALPIPLICLSGRVPPRGAIVNLDVSSTLRADLLMWSSFHNGVAAGLRISTGYKDVIGRHWILYNRPDPSSTSGNDLSIHAHGGLLLACGLHGYLSSCDMTDLYEYLTMGVETVTVGVLLGMAATKRGTADASVAKMLGLHIPSLLPAPFADLDVSSCVQTAAILGLGLVYEGTGHRLMTEFLLKEIGKRPTSDRMADREGYALAAGLALGMVAMSHDAKRAGLGDLKLEQRLARLMLGGKDPHYLVSPFSNRHANSKSENGSNGTNNINGANNTTMEQSKCSRIMEGEYLNTDVTSPGATLALGLIYMKSNDMTIANYLALPDTHFLLDYVRPDFLMLRVVARALIMWDDVQPTREWFQDQFPSIIQREIVRISEGVENKCDEDEPLRVDLETIRQANCYIKAGACLSLGLRFAGTGNTHARDLMIQEILAMKKFRDGESSLLKPARQILETCLCAAILGLTMVMSGTGDLACFRILRSVRAKVDSEITYGHHKAISMSIGLLFLGGGMLTLGRSKSCIAALVVSLFPRFPSHSSDNQYHLQAFRHLYVLAVENRSVEGVDVDTQESVYVPLKVHLKDNSVVHIITPCVLPDLETISQIIVNSPRYFPLHYNSAHEALGNLRCIFVKRKEGHLSYDRDPHALCSLLRRPFGDNMDEETSQTTDFFKTFTEDPVLEAFTKYFCSNPAMANTERATYFKRFCTGILYDSLSKENPGLIIVYLEIYHAVQSLSYHPHSCPIWNLLLLRKLSLQSHFISSQFVQHVSLILSDFFESLHFDSKHLPTYLSSGQYPRARDDTEDVDRQSLLFGYYLVYNRIPFASPEVRKLFSKPISIQDAPRVATLLPEVPADTIIKITDRDPS